MHFLISRNGPKNNLFHGMYAVDFYFFRYCFQVPDKEVDSVATELLRELVRFQDRQFHKDPVKVDFSTLMI